MNVSLRTAKLFLKGDEAAVAEVYQNYKALLYFIVATYVKRKEDLDDIYQNIFLKLLAKRSEIKDPSALHQYLCAMAKNEAIDFLRKENLVELKENIDVSVSDNGQLDYFLPYNLTKLEKTLIGYKLTFGLNWKEIGELLDND